MFSGIATGLSRVFLLGLSLVVSRSVEVKEFGLFSSALFLVQLAAMVASLGLAQTSSQAVAAAHEPEQKARVVRSLLSILIGAGTVAVLVIAIAAPQITVALGSKVPTSLVRWTSAIVLLQLLAGGLEGILRGLFAFRWLPIAAGVAILVGGLPAYPLVKHYGANGALFALGAFSITQLGMMLYVLRDQMFGALLPGKEFKAMLHSVAAPTFVSGLFWNLAMMVPPLLMVREAKGLEDVAIWNAASQLRAFISIIPIIIVNASIPHLVGHLKKGDLNSRQIASSLALPMAAAIFPYVPCVVLSGKMMAMYGPHYAVHGGLLVLALSYVLLQVLGVGLFGFVLASGRVWHAAFLNLGWAILVIALAPMSIASGGAYALARLYLITYVPVDIVLALLAWRAIAASHRRPEAIPTTRPLPEMAASAAE
jgi:O-antigen/teichoic acid export membrane protein